MGMIESRKEKGDESGGGDGGVNANLNTGWETEGLTLSEQLWHVLMV